MNHEWVNRFADLQASSDANGNISFSQQTPAGKMAIAEPPEADQPLLTDLSRLAVIDVQGSDAAKFLQDQVCNDLRTIDVDHAQLNGYCNPKGRLLALFTVFRSGDGFKLLIPDDIVPSFVKRLRMFVLRADVTIESRDDLVCAGLSLPIAGAADNLELPDWMPALPEGPMQVSASEITTVFRTHNAVDANSAKANAARYVVIGNQETVFQLWSVNGLHHAAWPIWRWQDINAGVPNVYAASVEQFIPQMLNMQFIDGLSFKKGCYPGQEIVARMQYLGKLKKHMQHFRVPGLTDAPEPGVTLTTESNNNAGQVVDAIADAEGVNLLAVVNIDTPANELQLNGMSVESATLPYTPVTDSNQTA